MTTVKQEIDRLVAQYPWRDSKELFRTELEYLVALAEREQMVKDHGRALEIINKGK